MSDATTHGNLINVDDILMRSRPFNKHLTKIRHMLNQLSATGTKLALAKSQWCRTKVKYVELTVDTEGIEPQLGRILAIRNIKTPANVSDLCIVLRSIEDYAEIAKLLTDILRKDRPFTWEKPQEQSFCRMKDKLCCLAYPDKDKEIYLETSFSCHCLSATQAQKHDTDKRVVAYVNRPMRSVKRRFSNCERALLATLWAVEHF